MCFREFIHVRLINYLTILSLSSSILHEVWAEATRMSACKESTPPAQAARTYMEK